MWPRFFSRWTSELHLLSTCEVYKAVLSAARALLVQDGGQPCTWHKVGEPGTCVELKGISEHWAFSVSCPGAAPDGTGSPVASHIQLFLEAELQLDLLPKMKRKGIIHLRFALQCLAQIWFLRKGWQSTDTGKIILRYSLMTIDWARFLYSYRSHENNHWTTFLVAGSGANRNVMPAGPVLPLPTPNSYLVSYCVWNLWFLCAFACFLMSVWRQKWCVTVISIYKRCDIPTPFEISLEFRDKVLVVCGTLPGLSKYRKEGRKGRKWRGRE